MSNRITSLPSIAEMPLCKVDEAYSTDSLINLAVLPVDDAELRAAAINALVIETHETNVRGGVDFEKCQEANNKLHNISARTPGGIAWKLLEALSCVETERGDEWCWWRYMIQSAAGDALELERQRSSMFCEFADDVALVLMERRGDLIIKANAPDGDDRQAAESARRKILEEASALERLLADTPAKSIDGAIGKLMVLSQMMDAGRAPDGRDERLLKSAITDIQRLTGRSDRDASSPVLAEQPAAPAIAAE